ncbi:MAG: prepilin-type N-terminal cleavage/methylation domain-containing protein [Verrucomicrobiae bacterium]|nr:prepilin-type N-terminal cleavage/methylation domain-containing protein [Verrucomicrobiae bacterium]
MENTNSFWMNAQVFHARSYGKGASSAFTLTELLVATGILLMLAALFAPAITKAKYTAKQIKCISNLKQIHLGFQLYLNDNDGFYPIYYNNITGRPWCRAFDKILPITLLPTELNPVFICPLDIIRSNGTSSYGYNFDVFSPSPEILINNNQLSDPSKKLLLCDNNNIKENGSIESHYYLVTNRSKNDPWDGDYRIGRRHNNGANVLYADGHVDWHLRSDIENSTTMWK